MKKAFTLSEALVTLAIIGVLAAILIPVVDNVKPDKDKITYKKAIYSLESAVSNAMDSAVYSIAANTSAYWQDEQVPEYLFCASIAASLNTSGSICCQIPDTLTDEEKKALDGIKEGTNCKYPSSYENYNFKTTDGIRYWGLEGGFGDNDDKVIYVDRALGSNELNNIARKRGAGSPGLKIKVRYDGKITTGDDSENFSYENELINNSLQVSENKYDEAH